MGERERSSSAAAERVHDAGAVQWAVQVDRREADDPESKGPDGHGGGATVPSGEPVFSLKLDADQSLSDLSTPFKDIDPEEVLHGARELCLGHLAGAGGHDAAVGRDEDGGRHPVQAVGPRDLTLGVVA